MINGVLVLSGLFSTMVNADLLGDADDTYIGFQMTTSIDTKFEDLIPRRNQYNLLLIEQINGIKHGVALTQDSDGKQILNYMAPSAGLDIGKSSIPEYAVPIVHLDAEAGIESNSSRAHDVNVIVTLVALGVLVKMKHDLEKSWKPASPD